MATVPGRVVDQGGVGSTPSTGAPTDAGGRLDVGAAYREHARELMGFAVNALRDRHAAEDVVQEVFLRAWRAADRFDPARGSVRSWLFAIARNAVVDAVRRRARVGTVAAGDWQDVGEADQEVDDVADTVSARVAVVQALAALPAPQREVLLAVLVQDRSYAEVSARTGVAAGTLRSRTFYGLRALREALQESGEIPGGRSGGRSGGADAEGRSRG